ncbi:heparan-alpha-glucosaminide N-acetyltransferase domain-containing protein [Agromyces humi]|uniref:heparan-alpha-glucosaminide N-acetyltransferase domain-containing protein n=1 Tax=Agromyces humi TaxID=1766800 RepID=UPI001359B6B6|nr:heparan-alpha-glucosaminide N-acetyltransferase domain-containing protein [Agromyces humi]
MTVAAPSAPARTTGRILGLDDARFLALAGMMATHVWAWSIDGSDPAPWLSEIVAGKAAALFAVLAGVGIAMTTRTSMETGRLAAARLNLFGRGLAIVLVGLTLGLLEGSVLVILVYLGVTFWLVIPLLGRTVSNLLGVAIAVAIVWPIASSILRLAVTDVDGMWLGSASWADLADPAGLLIGLFVTGVYPVMTWLVYLLVGVAVGRVVIAAREQGALRGLGLRMAVIGASVAASAALVSWVLAGPMGGLAGLQEDYAGYAEAGEVEAFFYASAYGTVIPGDVRWLESPAPHTGTLFDLAITTGIAVLVIGCCLVLRTAMPRAVSRVLAPVATAGAAPLTIYTLHVFAAGIVALAVGDRWLDDPTADVPWSISSPIMWVIHVLGALLVGAVLMLLRRRGPLESLVSLTGRLFARLADRGRGRGPAGDEDGASALRGAEAAAT